MRIHRLWLLVIAAVLALLFAPAEAQTPRPEGAMGRTAEMPRIVSMAGEVAWRLQLLVRPPFLVARRSDIHVEVHVARHPDNRLLVVVWDGGSAGEFREQIDGDQDAVLHERWLRSQPAAPYTFVAAIYDGHGALRGREEARIRVPEEDAR